MILVLYQLSYPAIALAPQTPPTRKWEAREPESSGAGRARTDDPRLAKPVLSQLSYSPIAHACCVGQGDYAPDPVGATEKCTGDGALNPAAFLCPPPPHRLAMAETS